MSPLSSYPFGLAVTLLWCLAMMRGQATYWLARYVTEQTLRHTRPTDGWQARAHAWLASTTIDRGRDAVQRCGIAAVPLCYLTIGIQTVVIASAGVLRMRWPRFTLAQSVGALAWALIYATIGFAVWAAFFERAFSSGVVKVVLAALLATAVVALSHRWYVVHTRRRSAAADVPADQAVPDLPAPAAPGPVTSSR